VQLASVMLAKANRLVSADDYRRLVRRGRRVSSAHAVLYFASSDSAGPPRFGFIVAKSVGVAVARNTVRRRLKAMTYEALPAMRPGTEIVIRALPGSAQVSWTTLRTEVSEALQRGVTQA
jgi:ribonuclease P protein component